MQKKSILLTILSLFMLVLAGCGGATLEGENNGSSASGPAETVKPEDMKIGLSISTTNNPFFVDLQKGVVETAEAQGIAVQVVDAQDDTSTQLNGMDDLIQQGVDIILVNPVDSDAITPAVEAANAAGIPVITLDRSSAGGNVVSLIASDNVAGGEMAAEFIIAQIGEGGNVVQLEGVPGASATNERGQGFSNVAADKLNVVDSQSANFNRAEGLSVMENILQTQSDIQAVFAQNDEMALGAFEAIKAAGLENEIVVVGFDGNDDALAAIAAGDLDATVAQQPYEMGKIAVETAVAHLGGETVEAQISSPLELVKGE